MLGGLLVLVPIGRISDRHGPAPCTAGSFAARHHLLRPRPHSRNDRCFLVRRRGNPRRWRGGAADVFGGHRLHQRRSIFSRTGAFREQRHHSCQWRRRNAGPTSQLTSHDVHGTGQSLLLRLRAQLRPIGVGPCWRIMAKPIVDIKHQSDLAQVVKADFAGGCCKCHG